MQRMDRIIGRKPVLEALERGKPFERIYIQDSVHGPFEKEIRRLCKEKGIPLNRIPKLKLDKEVSGNHQGIYGLAALVDYMPLDRLIAELIVKISAPLILLLDGIQDIRNIGSIARTAEVFGVDGLVIPMKHAAPVNEVAIKTSAGAFTHLKVCRHKSMLDAVQLLQKNDFIVYGAEAGLSTPVHAVTFQGPIAIVMGSEEKGINKHLHIALDEFIQIPQMGKTQSLNVSVATGVILYEIQRQRNFIR